MSNVIETFILLAQNARHCLDANELIKSFPEEIQKAFASNDFELIKLYMSKTDYLANESHVTEIHR